MGRDLEPDEQIIKEDIQEMNEQLKLLPAPEPKGRHGRAPTREQEAEIKAILSYRRPHESKGELKAVRRFLLPLNPLFDDFGNIWLRQGEAPTTMFSAHVDDVDDIGGRRGVFSKGGFAYLKRGSPAHCLSADNGAGMWMLLELYRAGVPGLYVWHRAEECGGKGSRYFTENARPLLSTIKRAIAFDRRATHSVITHQRSSRCCSDEFGNALAEALNQGMPGLKNALFRLDDTGSFTDTANYTELVSECTNISVGFDDEHTPNERLDLWHLCGLRDACIGIDWEALPERRDPKAVEARVYHCVGGWHGGYQTDNKAVYVPHSARHEHHRRKPVMVINRNGVLVPKACVESDIDWSRWEAELKEADERDTMRSMTMPDLVEAYPQEVADILEACGYNAATLADDIRRYWPLG